MENEPKSPKKKIVFLLALLAIVGLISWGLFYFRVWGGSEYQAVFLNNGQVYFGKMSREGGNFPVLKDIYYLQVVQNIQPGDANNQSQNINLVKLGSELHGPTDEMRINRDSINFIEDLRADSSVVKAIQQMKSQEKK